MSTWLPIPGYLGSYEINNYGIVRSLGKQYNGKILNYQENTSGYYRVRLYLCGQMKFHFVHRLVALCFVPNRLEGQNCVNHINGNKKDNNSANLEWCTHSENNLHSYNKLNRKGAWEGKSGYEHHRSKEVTATNLDTKEIKSFGSIRQAGIEFGVSDGNIIRAIKSEGRFCKRWTFKYGAPNTQTKFEYA